MNLNKQLGKSYSKPVALIILTVTLVLAMAVAITMVSVIIPNTGSARIKAAHADTTESPYAPFLGQVVTFCGNQWVVVGINDDDYVAGTSAAEGTIAAPNSAMLLLYGHNAGEMHASPGLFGDNSNIYSGSILQATMAEQAKVCANYLGLDSVDGLADFGVLNTTLATSENTANQGGPAAGDGNPLTNQLFFPLSFSEAVQIPDDCQGLEGADWTDTVHKCPIRTFLSMWWLRSPGRELDPDRGLVYASTVADTGLILSIGDFVISPFELARPALQISLDSFLKPMLTTDSTS